METKLNEYAKMDNPSKFPKPTMATTPPIMGIRAMAFHVLLLKWDVWQTTLTN
jgi:hypothetical protein